MITPTGQRLLVVSKPIEQAKTKSGIYLTNGWDNAPESLLCEVIAAGPDAKTAVGTVVLVPQFAPTRAQEHTDDRFMIIPEEDVIGVITNEER